MTKIDFKKTLKHLYQPPKNKFSLVDVPDLSFLMIDGAGDPNISDEYKLALEALYPLAYKLKFKSKLELKRDYVVPPLEGLWWADDMNDFKERRKDTWKWRMMILQPDWISEDLFEAARAEILQKKAPALLSNVRFETYSEGKAVQILHLGSYDEEGPVLLDLHDRWLPENGYREAGLHHEIYLNDPRKTPPEKLKTILRQPVVAR